MPPATIVLSPSGRYCAELKPILAWYWYQPVTNTAIVGATEGAAVGIKLGNTVVGFVVGIVVGKEVVE